MKFTRLIAGLGVTSLETGEKRRFVSWTVPGEFYDRKMNPPEVGSVRSRHICQDKSDAL